MAHARKVVLATLCTMHLWQAALSGTSSSEVQGGPEARRTFGISVQAVEASEPESPALAPSPSIDDELNAPQETSNTVVQDESEEKSTAAPAVHSGKSGFSIHTVPEPKEPSFMPKDAGSQEVQAPMNVRSFTPDTGVVTTPEPVLVTTTVASTSASQALQLLASTTQAPNGIAQAAVPFLSGMQKMVGQAEKAVAPAAEQIQKKAGQAEAQLQQKAGEAQKFVAPAAQQLQEKAQQALAAAGEASGKSTTALPGSTEINARSLEKPSSDGTSQPKLRSDFQRQFTARKTKLSITTYDRTLVVGGCAVVVGATLVAVVARFLTVRREAQLSADGHESGLE